MVAEQLRGRDITDERVLDAISRIPRHDFVPDNYRNQAYADRALPLAADQTISQPYIVALMTQLAEPRKASKALDVGTGSGYQSAVLAELCGHVYSIEIVESLAAAARERLAHYNNVSLRHGDGYHGWPEEAPFDVIIVAAAPQAVPPPLVEQLRANGKLVIPVGDGQQWLLVIEKLADGSTRRRTVIPVAFVPLTRSN